MTIDPDPFYRDVTEEAHYRAQAEWSRLMRRWERAHGKVDDDGAEATARAALDVVDAEPDRLGWDRCPRSRAGMTCGCPTCAVPF